MQDFQALEVPDISKENITKFWWLSVTLFVCFILFNAYIRTVHLMCKDIHSSLYLGSVLWQPRLNTNLCWIRILTHCFVSRRLAKKFT
jgi:hypothetical protein